MVSRIFTTNNESIHGFFPLKSFSWPCWNAHTHLLPAFGGEVEAPEVLVVVKLRLCRTGEFATEDPELATALGHQHSLRYKKDNIPEYHMNKVL